MTISKSVYVDIGFEIFIIKKKLLFTVVIEIHKSLITLVILIRNNFII